MNHFLHLCFESLGLFERFGSRSSNIPVLLLIKSLNVFESLGQLNPPTPNPYQLQVLTVQTLEVGENQPFHDLADGPLNRPRVNNHTEDLSRQLCMINPKFIPNPLLDLDPHLQHLREPTKVGSTRICPLYHQFQV